jgi:hypothetical protein
MEGISPLVEAAITSQLRIYMSKKSRDIDELPPVY